MKFKIITKNGVTHIKATFDYIIKLNLIAKGKAISIYLREDYSLYNFLQLFLSYTTLYNFLGSSNSFSPLL